MNRINNIYLVVFLVFVAYTIVSKIINYPKKKRYDRMKHAVWLMQSMASDMQSADSDSIKKRLESIDSEKLTTTLFQNYVLYIAASLSRYGYSGAYMKNVHALADAFFQSDNIWKSKAIAAELELVSAFKYLYKEDGKTMISVDDYRNEKTREKHRDGYGGFSRPQIYDLAFLIVDSLFEDDATNEKLWTRNSAELKALNHIDADWDAFED